MTPPAAPLKGGSLSTQTLSWAFEGPDLLRWQPHWSAAAALDERGWLIYQDLPHTCWHALMLEEPELFLRLVTVRLTVRPCADQSASLYLHQAGLVDLAEISPQGDVVDRGASQSLTVERLPDDGFLVELRFYSRYDRLCLGTKLLGNASYTGTGAAQLAIERIELEAVDASLVSEPAERRLNLVDVGGAGGLQSKWLPYLERISPILFEPNPAEAAKLSPWAERVPGGQVVQKGLFHLVGPQDLKITRHFGCTSLRQPNFTFLSRYSISSCFDVLETQPVECTRYDVLHAQGLVPAPDALKIDVQGCEHEVLAGFGALLEGCLGVELEAHLYPIYQGQKLLHDLVTLLGDFGLALKALHPVPNFDGDLVEVDAFFTVRQDRVERLAPEQQSKLELLRQVWGVE